MLPHGTKETKTGDLVLTWYKSHHSVGAQLVKFVKTSRCPLTYVRPFRDVSLSCCKTLRFQRNSPITFLLSSCNGVCFTQNEVVGDVQRLVDPYSYNGLGGVT